MISFNFAALNDQQYYRTLSLPVGRQGVRRNES